MKTYYIYYAPDYVHPDGTVGKVGCTKYPKSRTKSQGITNYSILETHTDNIIAGKRENELQVKYDCVEKFVKVPYIHSENLWKKSPVSKKGHKKKKEWIQKGLETKRRNGTLKPSDEAKKNLSKAMKGIKRPYNWNNTVGVDNPNSKFTEDDIRYIRKVGYAQKNVYDIPPKGKYTYGELANQFNCSKAAIIRIMNNKTYTSVK